MLWVIFAVVLKLQPVFVRAPFACRWLKGVEILAKRPFSLGWCRFLGGDKVFSGIHWSGGGGGAQAGFWHRFHFFWRLCPPWLDNEL